MDLLTLGRGLTYRRIGVLITALPSESAFIEAFADDHPGEKMKMSETMLQWSLDQRLLAMIAQQLAGANWQRGGGKGSTPNLFADDASGERYGVGSTLTREQKRAALAARAPKRNED